MRLPRLTPAKLPAFTLYELAVVLVLSSLVIYGSLTAYGFVAALIRDQQQDREAYHRLNDLDGLIREDLARATALRVATPGDGFETDRVRYTMVSDTLVRTRQLDGDIGGSWPCRACVFVQTGNLLQLRQGGPEPRTFTYELTFGPTAD